MVESPTPTRWCTVNLGFDEQFRRYLPGDGISGYHYPHDKLIELSLRTTRVMVSSDIEFELLFVWNWVGVVLSAWDMFLDTSIYK